VTGEEQKSEGRFALSQLFVRTVRANNSRQCETTFTRTDLAKLLKLRLKS